MKIPSVHQYKHALRVVLTDAPEAHVSMLRAHLKAPNYQMTATQLASAAGSSSYRFANSEYGKFAHRLCNELNFTPDIGNSGELTYTYVLAFSRQLPNREWLWTLRDEVIEALNLLDSDADEPSQVEAGPIYADEVPPGTKYLEGAVATRLINTRERDPAARAACLDYWGTTCVVCEIDTAALYGVEASRFIHVHHLQPLSSLTMPTETDPTKDLRPVCPNCHTALHMTALSVSDLRARLRKLRNAG